jgi:hypothetical protein
MTPRQRLRLGRSSIPERRGVLGEDPGELGRVVEDRPVCQIAAYGVAGDDHPSRVDGEVRLHIGHGGQDLRLVMLGSQPPPSRPHTEMAM